MCLEINPTPTQRDTFTGLPLNLNGVENGRLIKVLHLYFTGFLLPNCGNKETIFLQNLSCFSANEGTREGWECGNKVRCGNTMQCGSIGINGETETGSITSLYLVMINVRYFATQGHITMITMPS